MKRKYGNTLAKLKCRKSVSNAISTTLYNSSKTRHHNKWMQRRLSLRNQFCSKLMWIKDFIKKHIMGITKGRHILRITLQGHQHATKGFRNSFHSLWGPDPEVPMHFKIDHRLLLVITTSLKRRE